MLQVVPNSITATYKRLAEILPVALRIMRCLDILCYTTLKTSERLDYYYSCYFTRFHFLVENVGCESVDDKVEHSENLLEINNKYSNDKIMI